MIKTAALFCVKNNKILLVRVRDNKVWYFPGGKIDNNETPLQALIRELKEELNISFCSKDLKYIGKIVTDNHDYTDIVSIECFSGQIIPIPTQIYTFSLCISHLL